MSGKKKQMLTLILAVLCLIGAGIGYLFSARYAKQKEEQEAAEAQADDSIELYSYDEDSIAEITFKNTDTEMTLVCEDGTWYKKDDRKFPVDQEIAGTMASQVSTIISDKLVAQDCENLEDYGLDAPALTIAFTITDGSQVTLMLGDESTAAGGYYAYTSLSDTVYVFTSSVFTSYDYTEKELIEIEDTPSITADYVTQLSVKSKDGTQDFRAVYDEENAVSKDIYSWDIKKPFKETVAGDVYALSELFGNYTALEYVQCEDYTGRHDKKYGLNKPSWVIDVDYYTVQQDVDSDGEDVEAEEIHIPHAYQLSVGKKDSSGEYYYVKPADSERVYTMDAAMVENMVQIDAMSCIYANIYIGTVYSLNEIDMDVKGKSYHMELTRTETETEKEEGADSETETNFSASINGKEVDEEAFRKAYGAAGTLSYNGVIDESVKADDTPYCTVAMHEEKRDVTISFLPYDEKSYRVNVDGTQLFLTDKAAAEDFVEGFMDLLD